MKNVLIDFVVLSLLNLLNMNELKVITKKEEWTEELQHFRADWYHSWSYHYALFKRNEGKPILFIMTDQNHESIAIPLLLRKIDGYKYKDMTSVYGYPGFLFSETYNKRLYETFIQKLIIWSEENNIISIFSRLNPFLIDAEELKMCSLSGETVFIDLMLDEVKQKSNYRSVHRNLLGRLKKNGFKANWSNSQKSICDFKYIYRKTMKDLGANDYYFFDDSYFNDILNSKDFKVRIYNVWLNDLKVCSGIFIFHNEIVHYHLSGALKAYKNASPTIMLINQVRKDAAILGFKYFHLGGGFGGQKDGLYNFKYGFSKKSINLYSFKMIINENIYKKLSNISSSDSVPNKGFFPLYRKISE